MNGSYVCGDVIKLCDEGVFNDVHNNFRDDDHKNIRYQHQQVVWGTKTQSAFSVKIFRTRYKQKLDFLLVTPSVQGFLENRPP